MVRTGPAPQVHILNMPWSPADNALLGVGGNFRRWGLHEGQRPWRWDLGDCGGLNKNIPIGLCTGTVGGAVGTFRRFSLVGGRTGSLPVHSLLSLYG